MLAFQDFFFAQEEEQPVVATDNVPTVGGLTFDSIEPSNNDANGNVTTLKTDSSKETDGNKKTEDHKEIENSKEKEGYEKWGNEKQKASAITEL